VEKIEVGFIFKFDVKHYCNCIYPFNVTCTLVSHMRLAFKMFYQFKYQRFKRDFVLFRNEWMCLIVLFNNQFLA